MSSKKRTLSVGHVSLFMSFLLGFSFIVSLKTVCGVALAADTKNTKEMNDTPELTEVEKQEKAAVDRFWTMLERAPRRGTALDRVYGYYVDSGQTDQLLAKCNQATVDSPKNAKAWLLLGLVASRRNDDATTIKAFKQAESLDEKDALASYYLGEVFITQGRLREAAESLECSLQRKPARTEILAIMQTLGRVYERFGEREKSQEIWKRMEETFPNDLDILVRIAETLEEEGKQEEALERYNQLIKLSKNDNYARVRNTLAAADIKVRMGNKQEAIADFEMLLDQLSGESWLADSVRDRVERLFVRQADYAGLAIYYQKRLERHPNDLDTCRRLAVAYVRLGRNDDAKKLLKNTLEKAPSNVQLRLALIDLLVNAKDFDEVDAQYVKLNEFDPGNPDHITQRGLAALENKTLDEATRKANAAKIWLTILEGNSNDVSRVIMVADLMNGGNIHDEAEKLYKKAVALRPDDPGYKEYLGFFYHRLDRKDEALATLREIASGNRRNAQNLAQLSGILFPLGYKDEALAALDEATTLTPNDFLLQLRYADWLADQKDYAKAFERIAIVEKLVETDDERNAFTRSEIQILQLGDKLNETADALTEKLTAADDKKAVWDWWRLAMYRQAQGRYVEAVEAIEQILPKTVTSAGNTKLDTNPDASQTKPNVPLLVLQTAADLYSKNYDEKRAADIFTLLASADAPRRVEHLKRLACLQRDMGQADKAIETARLVMATGAGNAANSRFYADLLLGFGNRADGIEALRRAVRLDPKDEVSLSTLANVLSDNGQFDEAIEILWRLYEKNEDIESKLSTVSRMAFAYQDAGQFDKLVERLRQNTKPGESRREAAYSLAQ
ncbi:MAG: tetratricopeptide repeat protein, partial [Thermoguttaceae bacterium]